MSTGADAVIACFGDLLDMARRQDEPQRLLFVFAETVLPEGSTAGQRARFDAGEGGALVPMMAADKAPHEVESFAALVEESRQFDRGWAVVFVAALSGRGGAMPAAAEVESALGRMVEDVRIGAFGRYLPFDRAGRPLDFE